MTDQPVQPGTKIHPASREMLPEDPLDLHGTEVPGDPAVMLCMLVEEYARLGWDREAIMGLARDPFYQGFYGLRQHFGEAGLCRRVSEILDRVGVTRITTVYEAPDPEQIVQIDLPSSS